MGRLTIMSFNIDEDFGKVVYPGKAHRGKLITDIPSNYLKWVAENYSDDSIAEAADKEWHFREKFNSHWEND